MNYKISLDKINKYMKKMGWQFEDYTDFLKKAVYPPLDIDLIIPTTEDVDDYQIRINQIIQNLSVVEEISEAEIIERIEKIDYDLFKIRFISDKIHAGSFPLGDFPAVADNILKIVKYGACSAWDSKKFYTRPLGVAEDLTENCFIGQTEVGSYIFSVEIPHSVKYTRKNTSLEGKNKQKLLGRKAIITLVDGVRESNNLMINNKTDFDDKYAQLNTKLCKNIYDYLSQLMGNENGFDIEMSCILDPTWKDNYAKLDPVRILANEDYVRYQLFSEYLQKTRKPGLRTIEGPIISMEKNFDDPTNVFCIVTILNKGESKDVKHVQISLGLDDTHLRTAIIAFDQNLDVQALGTLYKDEEHNRWILEQLHFFNRVEKIEAFPFKSP